MAKTPVLSGDGHSVLLPARQNRDAAAAPKWAMSVLRHGSIGAVARARNPQGRTPREWKRTVSISSRTVSAADAGGVCRNIAAIAPCQRDVSDGFVADWAMSPRYRR